MKIETKFDVGQKVWFVQPVDKRLMGRAEIKSIMFDGRRIFYSFCVDGLWEDVPESLIFATKESAKKLEDIQNENNQNDNT